MLFLGVWILLLVDFDLILSRGSDGSHTSKAKIFSWAIVSIWWCDLLPMPI